MQANYAFGDEKGLGLDVSLFERLAHQKTMPVHQLLVQRRMRPEISELIRSTIYKQLADGDEVKKYPDVSGQHLTDSHFRSDWFIWPCLQPLLWCCMILLSDVRALLQLSAAFKPHEPKIVPVDSTLQKNPKSAKPWIYSGLIYLQLPSWVLRAPMPHQSCSGAITSLYQTSILQSPSR